MTRIRTFIAPAIGLGALVAGIVLGTSAPAIASTIRDVLVVNTTAQQSPSHPRGRPRSRALSRLSRVVPGQSAFQARRG